MRTSGNQPRLLTAVMEAIASLREGKGSTQRKILSQVSSILSSKNANIRNAKVQILRALKHGVKSGLIKQNRGKFKLGLDARDYAIFKNFQQMGRSGDLPIREYKKREVKRRSKRRRRRRGRRRGRQFKEEDDVDDDVTESGSGSKSSVRSRSESPEPSDRSRRRRKRRRGRRGRRRTDEKNSSESPKNSESKEITPKSSTDENVEKVRSQRKMDEERNKERREEDAENKDDIDEMNGCGNPQCLCNVKQETDENDIYRVASNESFHHYQN